MQIANDEAVRQVNFGLKHEFGKDKADKAPDLGTTLNDVAIKIASIFRIADVRQRLVGT